MAVDDWSPSFFTEKCLMRSIATFSIIVLCVTNISHPPTMTVLNGGYESAMAMETSHGSKNDAVDLIDIDKVCNPFWSRTDSTGVTQHSKPSSELLSLKEIQSVVKYWHQFNCPSKSACSFASLGQHLLHYATQKNKSLLTVQVGVMDGKSNDPMYDMFVNAKGNHVGAGNFSNLQHWLPVLIEPVPSNYEAMTETYLEIAQTKSLGCAVPIHAAASYDTDKTECAFCRVNTADNAPDRCKEIPDWMKFQIGTLDCDYSKAFFNKDFDLCVLQDPLPCSSVEKLLSDRSVPTEHTAIFQIDIEGYEYILLQGIFNHTHPVNLPPIIHFEHKVMRELDKTRPLPGNQTRMGPVIKILHSNDYVLYDRGEDYLAIKF